VFLGAWWVGERKGLETDVALAIAGAASALLLAPLGWWAGRERIAGGRAPTSAQNITAQDSGPAVGSVTGGIVIGAGSKVTFHESGPGVDPPGTMASTSHSAAPPDTPGGDGGGATQPDVELQELPTSLITKIIGRSNELATMRQFLRDEDIAIVSIVGFGGIGKSSLVDAFLTDIAPAYGGADRVFGWHFYSQEERGSDTSNSSLFWERALRFFRFHGEVPTNETEKAHELLRLFRDQRVILVLDGIESLQNPPHINQGLLIDRAVQGFLTTIARDGLRGGGLVIITSRQPVLELGRFDRARSIEIDMLDLESGEELLRTLGVKGSSSDLRTAVADYKGHPLSLVLLANILVTDHHGQIHPRFSLELLDTQIEENVAAILSYYIRAFNEHDPELLYMYLISLFRRPMREAELEELKAKSVIGRSLVGLPDSRLTRAVSHLRSYGLVIVDNDYYDTHALVRRFFLSRFRETRSTEFIQAHEVLFDYFSNLPSEELPSDMEGLEPLYRAVYHGCLAGKYASALDIYWHRISREREFYSQKQLGAFSSDLVAILPYFPDGWAEPVAGDLTDERRAWLLSLASFLLTALGRLTEAITPRYSEIAMFEALGERKLVCGDLRNLVQILIPLGRLDEALRVSERAVSAAQQLAEPARDSEYSHRLDEKHLHVSALACNATVLHRLGRLDEAAELFQTAERIQGSTLDRVNGYYYGLFLRDTASDAGQLHEVVDRGEENLRSAVARRNLGNIGSSHLTLGSAYLRLGEIDAAIAHFDEAVSVLRRANRTDRIPYAFIERARLYREQWLRTQSNQYLQLCESDMDEADQLISFSRMALFSVELGLLAAQLLADRGRFADARELIQVTVIPTLQRSGYWLRLGDVEALIAHLDSEG
jgi:tetratricopeptide (TPR) repeat protein